VILDVSDVQYRLVNPQIRIVSKLFWDDQGQAEQMRDIAMRLKLTQWLASALAIGATAFLAPLAEGQTDSVRERVLGPDGKTPNR
jgi:hypothetical protein